MIDPEKLVNFKIEAFEQSIKGQSYRDQTLLRQGFAIGAQAVLDTFKAMDKEENAVQS